MEGGGSYNGNVSDVADWIVARPRDAKVTAFSVKNYNYDLKGRVVPRSATQPRATFAAAPDDPLLKSGLNASNSFRASIYPVNNYGETTVSGTWVQVLGSASGRSLYRLPLLSLRGATTRLNSLNVKISVRADDGSRISNNYGLAAKTSSGARVLSWGQKNYRVTRDLNRHAGKSSHGATGHAFGRAQRRRQRRIFCLDAQRRCGREFKWRKRKSDQSGQLGRDRAFNRRLRGRC